MTELPPAPSPSPFSEALLNLIVMLLAPMFLSVTGGDIDYARMAAMQTVKEYQARTASDLLLIAQVVGFGIAALDSLRLAAADDVSVPMVLRLRGNATSCHRAAERHRRTLADRGTQAEPAPPIAPPVEPDPTVNEAAIIARVAQARQRTAATLPNVPHNRPATPPDATPFGQTEADEQQHRAMWAAAAARVAGEFTAAMPNLPPAERRAAAIRADVLSRCANDLLSGPKLTRPRPGDPTGSIPPGPA